MLALSRHLTNEEGRVFTAHVTACGQKPDLDNAGDRVSAATRQSG